MSLTNASDTHRVDGEISSEREQMFYRCFTDLCFASERLEAEKDWTVQEPREKRDSSSMWSSINHICACTCEAVSLNFKGRTGGV